MLVTLNATCRESKKHFIWSVTTFRRTMFFSFLLSFLSLFPLALEMSLKIFDLMPQTCWAFPMISKHIKKSVWKIKYSNYYTNPNFKVTLDSCSKVDIKLVGWPNKVVPFFFLNIHFKF